MNKHLKLNIYFRRFMHQHKTSMRKMCPLKTKKTNALVFLKMKKCALFSFRNGSPFFLEYCLNKSTYTKYFY